MERLKEKIEKEEGEVSDDIANIAHTVAKDIISVPHESIHDTSNRVRIESELNQISKEKFDSCGTLDIISKKIDISTLHSIFQELIRIQTGKSNGTRYHPI
ncbi:hypothetical protein C1646_754980 [Rhizophagus diaphanus]|nr:hypothetical protein C1646_754980 [Rhizophagus diaphanus] [Rhizophagus sp. MUCL 43196]